MTVEWFEPLTWNGDKPPAIMFYVADFIIDEKVELMTTQQIGAYMLLLFKAWHQNPIATVPADDEILARWARMTPDDWQANRAAVLAPWTQVTPDRFCQRRLLVEAIKFGKRRAKATTAAASRWPDSQHRPSTPASMDQAPAQAMPGPCDTSKLSKRSEAKQESKTGTGDPDYTPAPTQPSPEPQDATLSHDQHPARQSTPDDLFERFWSIWPRIRRTAKRGTKAAWDRAIKRATAQVIFEAAVQYSQSPLGRSKYASGPTPWLNGDRWLDDPISWQRGDTDGKSNRGMTDSDQQLGEGF